MATSPKPAGADAMPEQFGPYRIEKRLGQGGMGTVYLALDTRLNRKVGLKICHLADNATALQRFKVEAQAAAALRHPNLCPVYDCDVLDGKPYFTMAFIEGPMLDKWVAKRGGVTQKEAAVLTRKLALALSAAHKAGVIHRDLKPANVVLDKGGEPVILDFGLARQGGSKEQRLTQQGAVMGTPSYMAPEQVSGDVAAMGLSCDIYSLGVMMYELLTGTVPFRGDMAALLGQILFNEPKPPRQLKPDVDPRLEAICLKALAKKPEDRWPAMSDFAAALGDWLKAGAKTTPPARPATPTSEITDQPTLAPTRAKGEATLVREPMSERNAAKPKRRKEEREREGLPIGLMVLFGLLLMLGAGLLTWVIAGRRAKNPEPVVQIGDGEPKSLPGKGTPTTSTLPSGQRFLRFTNRDYVELTKTKGLLNLTGSFTVEFWLRLDANSHSTHVLMGDEAWSTMNPNVPVTGSCGWTLRTSELRNGKTRTISFNVGTGLGGAAEWFDTISEPVAMAEANTWHHVAVCKTPQEIRLFWDGRPVARKAAIGVPLVAAPTDCYLGIRKHGHTDRQFFGDIRAFRISSTARYDRDFKPSEEFAKDNETMILLDFSGKDPALITDVSGNDHHGVINGPKCLENASK